MDYYSEILKLVDQGEVEQLNSTKGLNWGKKLTLLRYIMGEVGIPKITLSTSESLGLSHSMSANKNYELIVTLDRVTFMDDSNTMREINDTFIMRCSWFSIYIYLVEMDMQMRKIYNHIKDSKVVMDELGEYLEP